MLYVSNSSEIYFFFIKVYFKTQFNEARKQHFGSLSEPDLMISTTVGLPLGGYIYNRVVTTEPEPARDLFSVKENRQTPEEERADGVFTFVRSQSHRSM